MTQDSGLQWCTKHKVSFKNHKEFEKHKAEVVKQNKAIAKKENREPNYLELYPCGLVSENVIQREPLDGTWLMGEVGVDSGTLMIGDPCYLVESSHRDGSKANQLIQDWDNGFCEIMNKNDHDPAYIGDQLAFGGFGGDGGYQVVGVYKGGMLKQVKILFSTNKEYEPIKYRRRKNNFEKSWTGTKFHWSWEPWEEEK